MRVDRRLVLIGVMLIVLSMTMATQYASLKVGYTFSVVHPSDADIRFIASDNAEDAIRVLRVNGTNASTDQDLVIHIGNLSVNQNKTYTAAFGIVNEEGYAVNITHAQVSVGNGAQYMQVWLHGDRDKVVEDDSAGDKVMVWDKGSVGLDNTTCAWQLAAGNANSNNMCADGSTQITTGWDTTANVRWSQNDDNNSVNQTSDFVWVQISIDVPANADSSLAYDGTIYIFTAADTY